ncbi:transposase [Borreliella burgdorferi]|uniref:Transposase, OrfB family n=1 Tax=Borreliella burgdorferi 118a TaxID=476210 RepID=A0A7U4DJ05_BORBG|nr:transposase [Borreliella burgdorferi]ACM10327.1 transposase, OrfB family [Borreliella burgdorferi 72a]ACN55979.1 transposase, OrfB family [Borreliella burgdorferi CA-11.2A]ACN93031.1 transposase, OrfB family [Borreliella burgdorferi 118a]MCD2374865.1 transposase [Borreliella burgdorferi]MCD2386103.1 transposase [Borreliella burgdorferi]
MKINLRNTKENYQKSKKGSINRAKSKLRVVKLHKKISNQRKDFLHKLSYCFATNYKSMVIDNLSLKGMIDPFLNISSCYYCITLGL